jgi:hypothetical protein
MLQNISTAFVKLGNASQSPLQVKEMLLDLFYSSESVLKPRFDIVNVVGGGTKVVGSITQIGVDISGMIVFPGNLASPPVISTAKIFYTYFNGEANAFGPSDSLLISTINRGFDLGIMEYDMNPMLLPNFSLDRYSTNTGATDFDYSFAFEAIKTLGGRYGVAWVGGLNDLLMFGHT